MTSNEIDTAIQGAFDGTLSEAECIALRTVLKSDPSARALYYEHAGLHQGLIYRLSRGTAIGAAQSLASARLQHQTRRNVRLSIVAAAAIVICAGLVLRMIFTATPPAMATIQVAFGSQFTVEHAHPQLASAAGELDQGSTVYLTQGALEVKLRNGSQAVLLAPATFHLQSENRMRLQHGTAWFRVSEEGQGFQVATPEMLVTDLGTEFGVLSRPDAGDEVHVFSGKIIAGSFNGLHRKETLSTGQARICDPVGNFKAIPFRPEDFLMKLPGSGSTGLIANGDFEAGNKPANTRFGSGASAAFLPSWNFGAGISVGFRDNTGALGYGEDGVTVVSSTADVQIGFQDDTVGQPAADDVSIRQSFTTVPGTSYRVHFEMGALFFRQNNILEITASVRDGMDPATGQMLGQWVERCSPSQGNSYNVPVSFTFTAASNTATLVFTETSSNTDDADPVIDNISVRVAK